MKAEKNIRIWVLTIFVFGFIFLASGCEEKSKGPALAVGNGLSELTDPAKAAEEAAEEAKASLGGNEAKLVLVFDSLESDPDKKEEMLNEITEVFASAIIYGCSTYDAITQESNKGKIGVLALGGDIVVAAAVSDLTDGHKACGRRIGQALKEKSGIQTKGKLLIMFGSCHVPSDNDLTLGAAEVLDESIPIIGGAASSGEFVYYQGKVVPGQNNLGILITGDFQCGFSMIKKDGKEAVIASAGEAFASAANNTDTENIKLMFAFDCGGRRETMGEDIPRELEEMKKVVGEVPIFGFYGSGEIGKTDNDTASRGDGFHLSVCALSAQ